MSDENLPAAKEKRSLMNLCLDLIELDLDAPENKEIVEKTFKDLVNKVDSYAYFNAALTSQVTMLETEAKHIKKQIDACEKVQEFLKSAGLNALRTLDTKEIKTEKGHKIQMRNSQAVIVYDIDALPDWAVEVKKTKTAKKTEIKEHLEAGQTIPGALIEKREYVVIK
jgi:uncharacterized protein YeeX (DUF496 family)